MKHEVRDGNYDLMEVSIDFLRERYRIKQEEAATNEESDERTN